ncbi:MAG: nucleotidyltransferase [Candidatus Thiodiazotropha sp. (ex Lucinoma borealis)]|nr:nucleotidyltransferase [Candidatus Thiodiazotropha sp. (ex Lucinoma borealis)]MCU7866135.1 nucleotidyltransferase [Candidatus Thiodiazotropha sp. (ex Lucinoma borealis)]
MSIQKHFRTFHDAIKLSKQDDAYKAARERDGSITKDIRRVFKDASHPVIEDFIQGSFSTDTAILKNDGDFDIDRAIVIDEETAPENPVTPKIVICDDVLEKRGFKNAKVKKPCVTADYMSENLHIDFPVYRKTGGSYELAIGKRNSDKQNQKWENADPKGLSDWIKDKSAYIGSADSKLGQYNRIVRFLKRWRDEKFSVAVAAKVYSIGITVMAKRSFSPYFDDDGAPDDLTALKSTVSQMLIGGYFSAIGNDQYQVSVTLPVQPWRDIFNGSSVDTATQFRNKLKRLESKLQSAISESDEIMQCKILRDMFGEDFPVPEKSSGNSNTKKATFSSAGAVGTSQGA